jgi:hypothetical protein
MLLLVLAALALLRELSLNPGWSLLLATKATSRIEEVSAGKAP